MRMAASMIGIFERLRTSLLMRPSCHLMLRICRSLAFWNRSGLFRSFRYRVHIMTMTRNTMSFVRRDSPWFLNMHLLSLPKAQCADLMRWSMSLLLVLDCERVLSKYCKSLTTSKGKSPILIVISDVSCSSTGFASIYVLSSIT